MKHFSLKSVSVCTVAFPLCFDSKKATTNILGMLLRCFDFLSLSMFEELQKGTCTCSFMVTWVVEFPREGYKIVMIFGQSNIIKGKYCMYLVNSSSGEVAKSAKIELSKSIISVKNYLNISFFNELKLRSTRSDRANDNIFSFCVIPMKI